MLEHNAAFPAGSVQRMAVDLDTAVRRLIDTLQHTEQRGFSAAARANHADKFARADAE